jgi:hypothetical protein
MATIDNSNDTGIDDEIALAGELAELYANPDVDNAEFEAEAVDFWSTKPTD